MSSSNRVKITGRQEVYRERVIERVGESVGYNKTGKSLQKEKV